MYIKYADHTGKLAKGDIVLMSAVEWANSGKLLNGVPVTITPDGKEPVETTEQPEPTQPELPSEQTPDLVLEIVALKERLAKVEAVPIVKAELIAIKEPIIKDPILTR